MKKRNGRWHKEKQIRRLQTVRDELYEQSRKKEYIPLEKPIWAGWDISVGLSHEAKFRKDAEDLQRVLNHLDFKGYFTKDVRLIRFIRKNNFTLDSYRNFFGQHYYFYYDLGKKHIGFHEFNNLPEDLKYWFSPDKFYKYSTDERPYYTTKYSFPWYAFRLYITKSYNTHKIVYDTQAQSEYNKLKSYLCMWDIKTWGRDSWRDDFRKSIKSNWNNALREIVHKQFTEEDILDYKFPKCHDKKPFGWS